jgi:UDP-N-acetylmuramoyl-tripeptide--D-alanyl-D-alanine ligase
VTTQDLIPMKDARALVLTAADIAGAIGGRVVAGDPGARIDGFSIDTRTLRRGDLFFALQGERFDAHQFVGTAFDAGASGAIVARPEAEAVRAAGARPLIEAADTTRALQLLARHVRRASGGAVVAITGSAGKTTTKEITAELLSARYRVLRNPGNLNNHIGLPLSLLEMRHGPEVMVVELGMNHAGEISTLVEIAEPDVRVWTNVSEVHAEFFASIDEIADAKAEILERARDGDLVVANADDPRVMARAVRFAGRIMTFGIEHPADVRAERVRRLALQGIEASVRTPAGEVEIRSPLAGEGNLLNLLAATAVAVRFGIPLAEIASRAARLRPAAHRGEVLRLPGGVTIFDDSYNSNPAALRRALAIVAEEQACGRRVAIVGEMLELGRQSVELHEACGAAAAGADLQLLVTVGGEPARALGAAAVRAGMAADAVRHLASSDAAAEYAAREVRAGDLVLVKGSRGIGTDQVVARLRAEFA